MKPKLAYQYTEEERRVITQRYSAYVEAIRVIAEIHGLGGTPLVDAQDHSGLIDVRQGPALPEGKEA